MNRQILSATGGIAVVRTAAYRFFASKPTYDDRRRTTCPRVDRYRRRGTVHGAGPALHTRVFIYDPRFFIANVKNPMRAYINALPAADAFFGIIGESRYIF